MEVNGRRLCYAGAGQKRDGEVAPPVVLLHGFGGFFMDWPRVMATLSRHTRVYALDLPGWGFSEPNPHVRSLEDEVKVVSHFINNLDLHDVVLCGISYGAGVAWAAAALHMPRLRSIVLLNPMPPNPLEYLVSPIYRGIFFLNSFDLTSRWGHRMLNKSQYKVICRENLLNDRLLDTFYLDLAYMVMKQPKMPLMLRAHAHGAKALDWGGWEHRLNGIRVPTTILQGREDRIFSLRSAKLLHQMIPGSELIEVADCGHAMVFDQHRRVSEAVARHIAAKDANELLEENIRKIR